MICIFYFIIEEARTDCALNKCHHICDVSPSGAKCRCHSGYHMLQNHTCTGTMSEIKMCKFYHVLNHLIKKLGFILLLVTCAIFVSTDAYRSFSLLYLMSCCINFQCLKDLSVPSICIIIMLDTSKSNAFLPNTNSE